MGSRLGSLEGFGSQGLGVGIQNIGFRRYVVPCVYKDYGVKISF